jgi:tripartite-type tricarboxylate transporter receptor subunit TctC
MTALIRSICVLTLLTAAAGLQAQAEVSVKPFYEGKTIRIIIPYPPGGSYDRYSRIAAAHMGNYVPGNPTIIVQNKSGIAGTLRDFANNLPDDGTVMGMFPETIGIDQLTSPATGQWDVSKLAYLGSFASVNSAFILAKAARAKNIEDFKTVATTVGCNAPVSQSYSNPAMLKNLLGYQFKIICGYKGNTSFPIAMLQGEIDLVSGAWNGWSDRAEVKDGTFKVVIQAGLKRHPDLLDVPLIQDLVTDAAGKKVVEFWCSGSAIGRALVVRKTVPQDRIEVLRAAFDKAMADPILRKDAANTNLEIDPTPGPAVQRISEAILDTPNDIVKLAIKAVQ